MGKLSTFEGNLFDWPVKDDPVLDVHHQVVDEEDPQQTGVVLDDATGEIGGNIMILLT